MMARRWRCDFGIYQGDQELRAGSDRATRQSEYSAQADTVGNTKDSSLCKRMQPRAGNSVLVYRTDCPSPHNSQEPTRHDPPNKRVRFRLCRHPPVNSFFQNVCHLQGCSAIVSDGQPTWFPSLLDSSCETSREFHQGSALADRQSSNIQNPNPS